MRGDEELAPDTGIFDGAGGDNVIVAAAKAAAYRRDPPRSVAGRASRAAAERTVSLRPAEDAMTYLTALLPVAQGVAVYAALCRAADSGRFGGDAGSGGGAGSSGFAGSGVVRTVTRSWPTPWSNASRAHLAGFQELTWTLS